MIGDQPAFVMPDPWSAVPPIRVHWCPFAVEPAPKKVKNKY